MNVGVCGLGLRMAHVVGVFAKVIPDFNVVAYADPHPVCLPGLEAGGISIPAGYENCHEMLAAEQLDLVMIGSPNIYHFEHIRQALDAGVRIFCEKPIVTTESQTWDLLALIREHGLDSIMVGLVLRYAPIYQDLMRSVSNGDLGRIMSIEASEHICPDHGAFFMRDWRRKTENSGGFMLEKCCHDLDVYNSVAGARPVRVASFGGRSMFTQDNVALEGHDIYHTKESLWDSAPNTFNNSADIVDHQVAIIEYDNGVRLCFHTNLNVPDEHRRFCVIGTAGMAEGDFVRACYKSHNALTGEAVDTRTYQYGSADQHYGAETEMARALASHFSNNERLPVTVIDALVAGITALKIDEARLTGQVLNLEAVWQRFAEYGFRGSG